jgi:uncharacterized membrane protein
MGKEFSKRNMDQLNKDPRNYKFNFIYWNKWDKRIIVPKRIPALGWTLNFANPVSYIILIVFVLLVILIGRFF